MSELPDWADESAKLHLIYLDMCPDVPRKLEYLAAVLRQSEARGALRASDEIIKALVK